jgi:hypothetical protein
MVLSACDDPQGPLPPQTAPPSRSSDNADRARDAERFAPQVWLADGDEYGPGKAQLFIEHAELRWAHDQGCGDEAVADPVDSRTLATGGYTHQGKGGPPGCEHGGRTYRSNENTRPRGPAELGAEGFYLTLTGDEDLRAGTGTLAPTYWQYYKGAYIYWFFYPYNDAPSIPVGPAAVNAFDHEGDWERIAVRTDGEGARVGVTLWGHGNSCFLRGDQLEWVDDHPVVYSAKGTHASYADDGIHRYGVDRTSAGTRWETWQQVRPIADEPWYGYGGAWGSVGAPGPSTNHRTGPAGPQPDREPTNTWTEHHCTEPDQLPAGMQGEWRSPEPAEQPDSDKTYHVQMSLTGGATGTEVGTVSYPGLECSGTLELLEVTGNTVTVQETITNDPQVTCTPRGTISLSLSDDVLDMSYTTAEDDEATMTARLVRQPGTPTSGVPADRYRHDAYGETYYFFTSADISADRGYSCGVTDEEALCQGTTEPVPPPPDSCSRPGGPGWGHGMFVAATGKVDFVCAGGLVYGPDDRDVLQPGESFTALGFTCAAKETGVHCVHDASGHGFFIAPDTNERF